MATAAQIAANRANAQHSTGPKTEEGKARSSQNNFRSGLTSRELVVLPGQEDLFVQWITSLDDAIQPCGALEFDVFRQLAHASWTLHRCRQAEVQSFNNQRHKGYDILAYPVSEDTLKLIDLYTRRAERSYQRALKELKNLQTDRLLRDSSHPAPAPLADPRIVNQQKQFAAGEKTFTAGAGQTRETETAAATAGDFEKSNPIERSQESGAMNDAPESRTATPPLRAEAAASGSGGFEKSNPIQPGQDNGASNAAPESHTATPPLCREAAASGSGASEKSNPIPGGSSVLAAAPPAR
jgi:hypothetical protein